MPKFPEPPSAATLAALPPDVRVLPAGTELWRVYFRAGAHPTTWSTMRAWGPTDARFDHHPPPARLHPTRSVLCAAEVGPCAVAEVFQRTRLIDRGRSAPWLVSFLLQRDVSLLDLTGTWPTRAGASMNINSGPRPRARRWSQRIHAAYSTVEGLYYASSMYANAPAVALHERAASAIPAAPTFHRALNDPALVTALENVASQIGYGLI